MDAFLLTYPQKKFMQNVRGRKKYPVNTYPKEKKSVWIKGFKKNHAHTKSPTPLPPPKKIKMIGPL